MGDLTLLHFVTSFFRVPTRPLLGAIRDFRFGIFAIDILNIIIYLISPLRQFLPRTFRNMFRVGSWLYGKKPAANASTQSLDSLVELRDRECSFWSTLRRVD